MPVISVIIPTYNAERTILETIQSIQKQTFSDFELIVINDGSTDRTLEVLSMIQEPRLEVFPYENGGLPVARNRGMKQATGEFITFIDADDLWTPDKLQLQLDALREHPEAGVAYSWTAFIDEKSNLIYVRDPRVIEGDVYPQLLLHNFISSGSNILVRKQWIEQAGEFDPSLKSAEDWDYYLRLAALCPFVLVPQYQILYRRSSGSMTSKVDVMEKSIITVIERAFATAPQALQFLKSQSLANTYRFLAQIHLAHNLDREGVKKAKDKLQKALQFYPKIALDSKTFRLILKVILLQLFPYNIAKQLTQSFGKLFPQKSVHNTKISQ